jgi:hypothetical protein
LKEKLIRLAAWMAGASLLSGCIDPGPTAGPVAVPQSLNSAGHTATLSWEAPTANTNGSPLTDLSGYHIYYGTSPEALSRSVKINTIGLQTYVIDDLEPGTWYFAVRALASDGAESPLSDVVVKTIS